MENKHNTSQSKTSSATSQSSQQGTTGKGGLSGIADKLQHLEVKDKLQQFGTTASNKVNNLSTTQKVVGGSILALGAGWIAVNSMNKDRLNRKISNISKSAKKKSK